MEDDDDMAMGARKGQPRTTAARRTTGAAQHTTSAPRPAPGRRNAKPRATAPRPAPGRRNAQPRATAQRKTATHWKATRPKTVPIHGWQNPVNTRQMTASMPGIRRAASRFKSSSFRSHLPHFMNRYLYTQPANTSDSVAALHAILDQADEAFQNGSQVPMAELAAAFAAVVTAMSAPADAVQQ